MPQHIKLFIICTSIFFIQCKKQSTTTYIVHESQSTIARNVDTNIKQLDIGKNSIQFNATEFKMLLSKASESIDPQSAMLAYSELKKIVYSFDYDTTKSRIAGISSKNDPENCVLRSLLFERFASLSPNEALSIISTLGIAEFPAGIANILDVAANSSPQALLDFISTNNPNVNNPAKRDWISCSLVTLAKYSPLDAMQCANNITHLGERISFLSLVLSDIANRNPDMSIAFAQQNLKGVHLDMVMSNIAQSLQVFDPEKAFAICQKISNTPDKSQLYASLFVGWSKKDPTKALEAIKGMSLQDVQSVFSDEQTVRTFSLNNNSEVLKLAGAIQLTDKTAGMLDRIYQIAGEVNPREVLNQIELLPESMSKNNLLATAYANIARKDTSILLNQISKCQPNVQEAMVIGLASRGAAVVDFTETSEVANQIPENLKSKYFEVILSNSTVAHPVESAQLLQKSEVQESLLKSNQATSIAENIANAYGRQNINDAQRWHESLPQTVRNMTIKGIMNAWVNADIQAASEWLSKLPSGVERDNGVNILLPKIEQSDPERAKQWKNTLSPNK